MSKTDDDHLCGLCVFWSGWWFELSFTRSLEEPARGSGEVGTSESALLENMSTLAWAALLGDGGRLLKTRNGENSAERKWCFFPCFFSDIVVGDMLTDELDSIIIAFT